MTQTYIDIVTKFAGIYAIEKAIELLDPEQDKRAIQKLKNIKGFVAEEVVESKKITTDLLHRALQIRKGINTISGAF